LPGLKEGSGGGKEGAKRMELKDVRVHSKGKKTSHPSRIRGKRQEENEGGHVGMRDNASDHPGGRGEKREESKNFHRGKRRKKYRKLTRNAAEKWAIRRIFNYLTERQKSAWSTRPSKKECGGGRCKRKIDATFRAESKRGCSVPKKKVNSKNEGNL